MTSVLIRRPALAAVIVACLAGLAGSVACHDPTGLPSEGPPDELRFALGGFGVDLVTIELRNETVLMWRRPWNGAPGTVIDTLRAVPTPEEWRAFWIAAERAGVHNWRSHYEAEGIVDGMGWTFRLVAGSLTLESTGSNAYPDWRGREHELQMTAEFRAFQTALENLVGEAM